MLRSVNSLIGYSIVSGEGEFGTVNELSYDSKTWIIRYLVVETGQWFDHRKVLISPVALKRLDWAQKEFLIDLTMEQIRHSPIIDTAEPFSRQLETKLLHHYQWPIYWGIDEPAIAKSDPAVHENEIITHLHGTHAVLAVHAVDGDIGHVEDYIVNSETWAVNYLVINTANWLPGKKVLVSPQLVNHLDVANKSVSLNLMKEVVESSQEFDPTRLVNMLYEAHLYDYYGHPQVIPSSRQSLFGF